MAVADVNGDARLDLVVANSCTKKGGHSVAVLLGDGDGPFQSPVGYWAGDPNAVAVTVADLDHNGVPDMAVARHSSLWCKELIFCKAGGVARCGILRSFCSSARR